MRPLQRPTKTTIYYHGREYTETGRSLVVLSINGIRWQYDLATSQADTVEHLAHKVSIGKALAFAKSHSAIPKCLDEPARLLTLLRHRGAQASRAKRMKVTLPDV